MKDIRTSDGRWYLMRILPYKIAPRAFSGTMASFTEITEIKSAETALKESERNLAAVSDTSPALVWMSGTDKSCYWFNKTWLDFTGKTLEQERGDGWTKGVHPDDLAACIKTYVEAFDKRQAFSMRYRLRRHDGEYRLIEDVGQPRFAENLDFLGYIGSCMDVSANLELENDLSEAKNRITELEKQLAQASAGGAS